jgi:hypothetical protein
MTYIGLLTRLTGDVSVNIVGFECGSWDDVRYESQMWGGG